jgi:hypothetical protein
VKRLIVYIIITIKRGVIVAGDATIIITGLGYLAKKEVKGVS